MRKLITRYRMKIFELHPSNATKVSSDLPIDYKQITLDNVYDVALLRQNTRLREFIKLIEQQRSVGVAAYYNEAVIGYGWAKFKGCYDKFFFIKNTEVYLASFFVSPDFRGHSVYPSLLQYFIKQFDHSESIKIAIEKQNGPSIRGAEKVGFLFTKQVNLWRACKLTIPKYTI